MRATYDPVKLTSHPLVGFPWTRLHSGSRRFIGSISARNRTLTAASSPVNTGRLEYFNIKRYSVLENTLSLSDNSQFRYHRPLQPIAF